MWINSFGNSTDSQILSSFYLSFRLKDNDFLISIESPNLQTELSFQKKKKFCERTSLLDSPVKITFPNMNVACSILKSDKLNC